MGMGMPIVKLINELRNQDHIPLQGSVVEIGAQQLANEALVAYDELEVTRKLFNISSPCQLPQPISSSVAHGSLEHLRAEAPLSRILWDWMGYQYASIDIDGSPNSIPLDLNYDKVPRAYRKKHHIVTNLGTTEHVANQLNAFKIIHDLTVKKGVMIHELPTQGFLNHGLINYNLKFFWMLARSNDYKWLDIKLEIDAVTYSMPTNILEAVSEFSELTHVLNYEVKDCSLTVVFQKNHDIEFIAPLDVSSGTKTNNAKLRKRYWTVFTPNAFEPVIPNKIRETLIKKIMRFTGIHIAPRVEN